MKIKDIMAIVAVALMTVGCSSIEEAQLMGPVPIKLTASVGVEAVTRGADGKIIETDATITRGIQENALATDETVYVWANEQGSSTWDYLKAWTLTNASTGLTGSTQYYPADGTSITMNAVHGNFAETLTEGTTAISSLTHSVLADQNAEKGYEKSDLLFGSVTGSKASTTAPNIAFAHKLSKIEVNLLAGYGYVDTDLSDAQVHLNNVKPSVTINAADGTIGAASGTAITIKTRKTGTGTFEAVIPPQTFDNPDALIAVTTTKDNLTLTSTVPNDVATYASDTRYVYNVNCSKTNKRLNPLWYVAENNVKSYNAATNKVTLETDPTTSGAGQVYNWDDAMAYFSKQSSSYDEYWAGDIYDNTVFKYHLPCEKEWFSIVPAHYHGDPSDAENIFVDNAYFVQEGSYTEPECIFGYSAETKVASSYKSYWSRYTTANVRYALRFLGTPYCSVWKYEWSNSVLTITAKLISYLAADTDDATLSSLLSTFIAKSDFWWNTNEEDEGAVQRKFYSVGLNTAGTATSPNSNANNVGYYWSTKEAVSTSSDYLQSGSGRLYNIAAVKTYGLSVRLFRSEGPGAARTEPGIAMASVTSADVGKVIATNGMVYPTVAVTKSVGATPSGIIAYVGSAGSVDASSVTYRGLAIALNNAVDGNGYWTQNVTTSVSGRCIDQTNAVNTAIGYMNGIACTTSLVNSNGNGLYAFCKNHDHHAAKVARNFSAARPEGVSLWFLPSLGQWNLILKGLTGTNTNLSTTANATFTASNVNIKIIAAGGTGFDATRYWASTEKDADYVWRVSFLSTDGFADSHFKTGSERVRSVFAF